MKREISCSGLFKSFPLASIAGLVLSLSTVPSSASEVVAYGYNMGVAPALTNAVAVGVSTYSLVALRADGTIAQWGNSASDPGISNVVAIATGWDPAFGLRADGTIIGWGNDYYGAISSQPADLTNAVAVAVGFYTVLAARDNGTVSAWGDNSQNLLNLPEALTNVVAVSAAVEGSSAMALRADGTVVEWNYSVTNTHPELSNVVAAVTGGIYANAVIHFDGSVTMWPTNSFYPVPENLTNIVAVAAGGNVVFLHNDGTVTPWGCECHSDFTSITNLSRVAAMAGGGTDGYNYNIFLIDYTNPPPVLAAETSNGIPRLIITGERFHHYVLEESTDLSSPANWTFKQNLVIPAAASSVVDLPTAVTGEHFYRARLIP